LNTKFIQIKNKKKVKVAVVSLSTISSSALTLFSEYYCIFPSRYLCTIGLLPTYFRALDGVYHPTLGCIFKQPDSRKWKEKKREI